MIKDRLKIMRELHDKAADRLKIIQDNNTHYHQRNLPNSYNYLLKQEEATLKQIIAITKSYIQEIKKDLKEVFNNVEKCFEKED